MAPSHSFRSELNVGSAVYSSLLTVSVEFGGWCILFAQDFSESSATESARA